MLALLGGCASLPEGPPVGGEGFEVSGRVAVRHGGEGASARIAWRHNPQSDDVLITSFLGQGIARVTRSGGRATLVTADNKEYSATDAESLTEQVLGWRLPLNGLPDWIQGRASASPAATRVARDAHARLSELEQDGWRVEFQEYDGGRPSRMRMGRGDMEIRFVVDQWKSPQ